MELKKERHIRNIKSTTVTIAGKVEHDDDEEQAKDDD
jgi:hypothetical protein